METDNMRESIQTGSRDVSIDIAKGILAICVIFGHVVLSGIGHDLVYAFHVPAFFIITGMMVRITDESVRGMPEILKKNILAILIPYTFFELLGGISYYIRCGFGQSVVGLIYNAVTMNCNNGPDWFLYTLFFAKVLFVLCMKCVGERKQWRNVYVAFSVVMMVAATVFCYETWVYMIIRHVVLAHGFITIGFVLCEAFRKEYLKAAIVALLAVVFISYFDISPDFHQMQFGNIYLYFISSIFGTYALLQFCKRIRSHILAYFGTGSLIIMGTHMPLLFFIRHLLHTEEFDFLPGLVITLVICLVEIPIIYIIQNYLPFLIGKKSRNRAR